MVAWCCAGITIARIACSESRKTPNSTARAARSPGGASAAHASPAARWSHVLMHRESSSAGRLANAPGVRGAVAGREE